LKTIYAITGGEIPNEKGAKKDDFNAKKSMLIAQIHNFDEVSARRACQIQECYVFYRLGCTAFVGLGGNLRRMLWKKDRERGTSDGTRRPGACSGSSAVLAACTTQN
jgi:hypothetical protein